MESALSRPIAARLPVATRVTPQVLWIWCLAGGLILYLGLQGGGYDLVVRSNAGVVVWWVVLLAAAWGILPAGRLTRAAWTALALLAGFLIWTAIASTWSLSVERGLEETSRLACYLGVLVLAVAGHRDRRVALRHTVAAVAAAIVLLCALALLSRLDPHLFPAAQTTASYLPGAHQRLNWPIDYWNALGALVALGLPLLLGLAGQARSLLGQALAAAAIPLVALTGYLTFSRGGAIAVAAGLIVFLLCAPERLPRLATTLVAGAGSAALIAGAAHRHAIEQGLTTAAARHQGASLLVAVVLVCAGVAIVQAGIGLAARHGTPPRLLSPSPARARALLAGALAVLVIAFLAAHGPAHLRHAWDQFKAPNAAGLHQQAIGRYGSLSGNGRYTYWKTALDAMPGHWLGGYGTGSFQFLWFQHAPYYDYIRNAHSLYIETVTEAGLVGLALIAGFLVTLIVAAVVRSRDRDTETAAMAAAAAAAIVAFAISAAFDWMWQVPVLPVAVLLLAGAVLAPERRPAALRQEPSPAAAGPLRRIAPRLGLVLVALACLLSIGVPLATTRDVRASQSAASAGDLASAESDARSAVALEPAQATPNLQLALVLELEGKLAPAIAAAQRSAAAEPDNAQPWLVLSRLQAESGHAQPALAAYRHAHSVSPKDPLFG